MCELCQPTPVLHPLSREKGYPTGELPLLPPTAQGRMSHTGGVPHWGLCIPPNHTKPRAGSWFSSTAGSPAPQVLQPQLPLSCSAPRALPRAGTAVCPSAFPLSHHLKLQGAALFFYSTMDFTTHPVLLPTDVPKLWATTCVL